jgi:ABC-2 type transport system permease protein
MRRALLAEWTKMATVRSNLWTMLALPTVLVAGTVTVILSTSRPGCQGDPHGCPPHDTTALMLSGVHFSQIAAIALAAATICSEFHPRMIHTTLAMNPRRITVFTAKAVVLAAIVLATAPLGVAGAVLLGRPSLTGRGLSTDLGYPQPALSAGALQRAAAGTVFYLVLVALFSVGVSSIVRHSGAAIGAVLTALYGPYLATLLIPMPPHTLHLVQDASPMTAGLAVQTTLTGTGTAPLPPWTGLAVLTAYTTGTLLVGGALFTARAA